MQSGVAFFIYVIRYDQLLHVTSILCYLVLGLSVASLFLTYLYSTDTFIFVSIVLVHNINYVTCVRDNSYFKKKWN